MQTVPFGINNRGVIVGKFTTADGVDHGFRRDARGRFTTIDVPGAAATQLTKINDRGQIVGYTAAPIATDPFLAGARGFLLARAPGDPSPDRRPRRSQNHRLRPQRRRRDRRPVREHQRRAEPGLGRRAADGPHSLTTSGSGPCRVAWSIATVLSQAPRRSSTGPVRFRPNRGRAGCEQRQTHAHRRGDHRGIHPTHQPWPPPVAGRRRRGRAHRPDGGRRRGHAAGPDGSASPDGGCDCDGGSPAGCQSSQDPRASSPAPGFLLERGRFTTVAIPPRLAATAPQGIGPMGINDRGQIVGEYIDDRAVSRGFLLDRSGRFTRIDVPGAKGTNATKINNRGQIVGVYSDTSPDLGDRPDSDPTAPTFKLRGFLLDRHGRFTRLDFPGSRSSQARSINDRGQVVGEYQDTAGSYHGYVWERGRFRTIDAPGAAGTSLFDSNDRGQLLGIRLQLDGTIRGFLLDRGRFTTFDGPGGPVTYAVGINEAGQIVGFSFDPADLTTISGFLRDARGRLSAINRPGAISTAPFGINNRGQIVGLAQAPGAAPGRQPEGHPPMGRMA